MPNLDRLKNLWNYLTSRLHADEAKEYDDIHVLDRTYQQRFTVDEWRITQLEKKVSDLQTKIDADTAVENDILNTLNTSVPIITDAFATLEKELSDAKAANPSVDLSKLETGLSTLKLGVSGLAALVPADAIPAPVKPTPPAQGSTTPPTGTTDTTTTGTQTNNA